MSTLRYDANCVNRYAALSPEECVLLAFLDVDRPEDGLERDPAAWPAWVDDDRWEPAGWADHTAVDEKSATLLFACDDDDAQEYVLDDDDRPRDRWCPSAIAAFEYQERR